MDPRLVSQSFLGPDSDAIFAAAKVGVVGFGGGGSHVVPQLAHLGVGKFVVVDPDTIENKNSNRLMGGTAGDVRMQLAKVVIAERVIRGINPNAEITACAARWQEVLEHLRGCDVIFGCVDFIASGTSSSASRADFLSRISISAWTSMKPAMVSVSAGRSFCHRRAGHAFGVSES